MIQLERSALVWGVVGNLGGGKTLSSVCLGVECILNGYMVVSNVTFDIDRINSDFGIDWAGKLYRHISMDDPDFDPFALPCGDPRGSGGRRRVIVILDEVAEWIDQYSSAKDPRIQRLWSWLRHSSKRSQDIVIICQRQEYINKVVRTLIARWIWVDDLAVWKIPKIRCKLPFCKGLVMQRVYDRLGQMISPVSWIRKARWGRYYNTAECLNATGASINEVYEMPDRRPRVSSATLLFYLASLVGVLRLAGCGGDAPRAALPPPADGAADGAAMAEGVAAWRVRASPFLQTSVDLATSRLPCLCIAYWDTLLETPRSG